jgi:hypothetical protein
LLFGLLCVPRYVLKLFGIICHALNPQLKYLKPPLNFALVHRPRPRSPTHTNPLLYSRFV